MKTEIKIPVWWRHGGMMYRRDCLPINYPEHTYNYIKNQLGLVPEKYGVCHPIQEKYKSMTKEQLISVIVELEQEIESYASRT